jgi:hypothetical protein
MLCADRESEALETRKKLLSQAVSRWSGAHQQRGERHRLGVAPVLTSARSVSNEGSRFTLEVEKFLATIRGS